MSVINRMLRELDARHESAPDVPQPVRAVPPATGRARWAWPAVVLGVLLLLVGAFALWYDADTPQTPRAVSTPAPQASAPAPILQGESALPAPPPAPTVGGTASAETPAPPEPSAPLRREPPSPEPPARQPATSSVTAAAVSPAAQEAAVPTAIKRTTPAQQADQLYREALVLLAAGRPAEGEAALAEALRLDPAHWGAKQALLAQYIDGKRWEEAERMLSAVLAEAGPGSARRAVLALMLARVELEHKGPQAALLTLERYAAEGERDGEYLAFHAALLQRLGRHGEAIAKYQSALTRDPGNARWWLGLGLSLEATQRAQEAEEAFTRASRLPGLTPELRAFAEERLGRLRTTPQKQ